VSLLSSYSATYVSFAILNSTTLQPALKIGLVIVDVWLQTFLTSILDAGKQSDSFPNRLTPQEELPVKASWNVMAHAQKPDFVFRRNGRVHLNRRGRQFSRLLTAEMCASAVVMLYTPYSEVVWRVLATHSIRQFPLHFPSHASPCAITFQLDSTHRTDDRVGVKSV
jgi:hypothetical protein